jgi:hypothetical protein
MTNRPFRAATGLIITSGAVLACGGGTEPTLPPPPPPNVEIAVTPALNGHFFGQSATYQLTATITDTLGNPLTGVTPLWSVFPQGVGVTVSQTGLVTVASVSQVIDFSIRATAENVTGSAIVRVLPRATGKLYFSSGSPDQQLFVKNFLNDLDAVQLTTGPGLLMGFDVDQVAGIIILSRSVPPNSGLFRMNLDGTGLTPLTTDGAVSEFPAIHSATNEVYFSRRAPGATVTQIWRMAIDGSDLTQITTGTQDKSFPAVSPDGQRLAWVETFPGPNDEIMTADLSGVDPVRLTDRAGADSNPFWVSASRIVWDALAAGNLDIVASDVPANGPPANLTVVAAGDANPIRGCNLNSITFLSSREFGGFEAFQLDVANGLIAKHVLPTKRPMNRAQRTCQ